MARPPYLLRHTSYRQAESAGQPVSTSQLDAEFNDDFEVTNQLNRLVRGITDATGKLINISAQLAQSLVGSTRFAPVIATTVFLTTVEWDSSFSSGNVQVIVTGGILDTTTYTVADNGGFLEVTVSVPVSSGWVYVSAYSQGAGIATMLASTDPGDGASQVGINDVDALYVSTNVEGALAEIAASFNALLATLGTLNKIWTNDGVTVAGGPAVLPFQMGNQRVIDMADGINAQDAVTLQQLLSITQNLATLLGQFIRADGNVPWTQNQSVGGNRLTDLAAPVNAGDAVNKTYADAVTGSAAALCLALNGFKTSPTRGTLTGGVSYGQLASAVADADQTSTPAAVVVPTLFGVPEPSTDDQVANKKYVDDTIGSSVNYAGNGEDGVGLGAPIATIVGGGVFNFTSLTIAVPQVLTRDTIIFCSGNINISGLISQTPAVNLTIYCAGNVSIGPVGGPAICSIRIFCDGDLTLTGALTTFYFASTNNPPVNLGLIVLEVGGTFTDGGFAITGSDVSIKVGGDAILTGSHQAQWGGSGASVAAGFGWYHPGDTAGFLGNNGGAGNGVGSAGGGGGGSGGGAGTAGGAGAGGPADLFDSSHRWWQQQYKNLRRGGGGGRPTGLGFGGDGGGRFSLFVGGDLTAVGAVFSADALQVGAPPAGFGGGGGGCVRVVCMGVYSGSTLFARGGAPRGGRGAIVVCASAYGVAPVLSAGSYNETVTLTALQIDELERQGYFGTSGLLPW